LADATVAAGRAKPLDEGQTLKPGAIGFLDATVIGLASTAPAYSLAAVIGTIVVLVGVQAPAALLASFIPMFFIATAFYYMNKADPDAGTTFSWVTRALGPWPGWIGGWAVCTTGILVVGSLADVGARYTYLLFGADGAASSKLAVTTLAVAYIVVLTAVCVIGTELSARVQNVMILAQVGALLLFAIIALVKVWGGDATPDSIDPSLSWLSPFEIDSRATLVSALLIGVFIYWGWESAVNLTEETEDSRSAPGLAAVISTVILLVTYVSVAVAVVAFAGLELLAEFDDDDAILGTLAGDVLGSPWDKLVILAIVTSAVASTQTTIIPASRTSFSMARSDALPRRLAAIHPRFRTPHISTIVVAALAIAWYVPANFISENFLFDTVSALALMIAFYYALSGFACVVYYRRELTRSVKNFVFIGLAPLIGGGMLAYLFIESIRLFADPAESYTGQELFGLGAPLVIGLGFLLLGVVVLILWRLAGHERFFSRRPLEAADPQAVE
jgi:amino acid transporter